MACVGKKVAKYTSGPLMANNCAFSSKSQTVQHQLTAGRNHHVHIAPGSLAGPASVQKRHRTTFSSKQLKVLEEAFEQNNYPCPAFREQIANRANLDLSRVQVWFQNRRAKHKKQMSQAMRCFAAAAAASTTASYQQPQSASFAYQSSEPQQHPQQAQPLDQLQIDSYGRNENSHQPDLSDQNNSLSLAQNFYLHPPGSLSHPLIDSSSQIPEQHLHQHPQHIQVHNEQQQQQQDLATSFEVDEFRQILNSQLTAAASISNYGPSMSFKPPNPSQNQDAFGSSVIGVGDEPRPRQQSHEPMRTGMEYL